MAKWGGGLYIIRRRYPNVDVLVEEEMASLVELGHYGIIQDNFVYPILAGTTEARCHYLGYGTHQRLDTNHAVVRLIIGHIVPAVDFAGGLNHQSTCLPHQQEHTLGREFAGLSGGNRYGHGS